MIYPGNYFITNIKVTAAAQQLIWPTKDSFLITYDFPGDLSQISVCDLIQNNPQRIIAKVIKEKKSLMVGIIEVKWTYWNKRYESMVSHFIFGRINIR